MKIAEFIEKYCQDIVEKAKHREILNDLDYTYDDIVETESGEKVKVVYADDSTEIYLRDILGLREKDFRKVYPSDEAYETYKTYLSNFIILEGEDVLNEIRNQIQRSRERIERYANLDIDSMISPF